MSLLLGCIADDFTGATDLANTLVKEGMRTTQVIGVPKTPFDTSVCDAVVVALKSRTIPPAEAVAQALAALDWLKAQGAVQFFWKYCSTFDSTDDGNIGPVADALLDALQSPLTIACPAFPTAGRTIFNGHLFVGDALLSNSGMKDHPLTPMRDANLVNVLARQSAHPVGLVPYATVREGADAVTQALDEAVRTGRKHVITDAITDAHLRTIGTACAKMDLITGGSGIALGLPDNFRHNGQLAEPARAPVPNIQGRQVILSGSCSQATRTQVTQWSKRNPAFQINPLEAHSDNNIATLALEWYDSLPPTDTPLFFSSDDPDTVAGVQQKLGREAAGNLVEQIMGDIAIGLMARGVTRVIVAGGETSGAIVQALGITALTIGPEIDPGVPWTQTHGTHTIALALKSGNFGGEDFFAKAFGMLS